MLSREAPVELEVFQQHRHAHPASARAVGQQGRFGLEQGPVLRELPLVPASFHGRTISEASKVDILTIQRVAAGISALTHMAAGCSFPYFGPGSDSSPQDPGEGERGAQDND